MSNHISLPEPQRDLPFPLMKALETRRSTRKWKDESLSEQDLSNLLWAACGITKPAAKSAKNKRTAPSACNGQEIKVYVATRDGLYLYDEVCHQLVLKKSANLMELIGTQKMMHSAPMGLIYVADFSKMTNFLYKTDEQRWFMATADTGFISENVYLYCAAARLSTVLLALVKRDKLHAEMGLPECEKIVFTQVVGYSLET
mgnify:FL=1